jgi:beta-glucanase (GH16 family)
MYKRGSTEWQRKDSLSAYTSAAIVTLNKKHFTYGRLEVRAKIPQGLGVWPAIWMLGVDRGLVRWPYCGEIDVMEFVGHDSSRIYGTMHYADTAKHQHAQNGGHIETAAPYSSFHVYAMEWDKKEINLFFDDSLYFHFNTDVAGKGKDNPLRKPFYLLLNLALGGSWGGHINDAILPAKYEVDYVRMYQ